MVTITFLCVGEPVLFTGKGTVAEVTARFKESFLDTEIISVK